MNHLTKAIALVLIPLLFSACASSKIEDVVTIRQIEATQPVVLRLNEDKSAVFAMSYPLAYKIKKNTLKEICAFGCNYYFNVEALSSGTGGCLFYIEKGDSSVPLTKENRDLSLFFNKYDLTVRYIIEKDNYIQNELLPYYERMRAEQKDTLHIDLKSFKAKHSEILRKSFEGDTISFSFTYNEYIQGIPMRVSFSSDENN